MRGLHRLSLLAALVSASVAVFTSPAPAAKTPAAYSRAVTEICVNALLFEGRHAIGTRAGAVEVARDIRSSTRRRLARVAALSAPPAQRGRVARWLALERRLAEVYASSYLGIYDAIDAARTPTQLAQASRLLWSLAHAPDALRRAAAPLEQRLRIPDCTGGVARDVPPEAGPAATHNPRLIVLAGSRAPAATGRDCIANARARKRLACLALQEASVQTQARPFLRAGEALIESEPGVYIVPPTVVLATTPSPSVGRPTERMPEWPEWPAVLSN